MKKLLEACSICFKSKNEQTEQKDITGSQISSIKQEQSEEYETYGQDYKIPQPSPQSPFSVQIQNGKNLFSQNQFESNNVFFIGVDNLEQNITESSQCKQIENQDIQQTPT